MRIEEILNREKGILRYDRLFENYTYNKLLKVLENDELLASFKIEQNALEDQK